MVILKRLVLQYKGEVRGYRVSFVGEMVEYDIDKQELEDLVKDWGVHCIDKDLKTVNLVEKDNKLYSSDGSDALSLSYLDVVELLKGYDDVDIVGVPDDIEG